MKKMDPSRLVSAMDPTKLKNAMDPTKFMNSMKTVGSKLDFLKIRSGEQQHIAQDIPPELMLTRVGKPHHSLLLNFF